MSLLVRELENAVLAGNVTPKLEPGPGAEAVYASDIQCTAAEATNAASSAAPMSSAPVTFTQSMGSGRAVLLPPPVDAEPIRFEPPDCMGGKAADNPDCRAPKS